MTAGTPKVSIGIPTYNGAAHVRATIESLLSQDFADFEIVVTDDNSADGTLDLISAYSDPRIRIERNPARLGAEGNWNRALALSKGTYFKLLPQDDLLLPGSLRRQVETLERDKAKEIAFTFGAREIIDAREKVVARRRPPGLRAGRIAAQQLARLCVRRGTNVIGEPGAILFRRELAERVGPFDAAQPYVIDLDYWLRLLQHGDAWFMEEPVAAFRVSKGSWSLEIGKRQSEQYSRFIDRAVASGLAKSGSAEVALGKFNAYVNKLMRLAFYKLIVVS